MGQMLGSFDLEGSWLGCNLRNRGSVHLNKVGLLGEACSVVVVVVVWLSGATRSHRATLSGEALLSLGSTTLTTVVEAVTLETVVWLHGLLDELEDLMYQLESIRTVKKKTGIKRESVVLLLGEEVSLVLVLLFFLLNFLWEFVVGHLK